MVPVQGSSLWYRVVGGGDATPLLVVHGGPGDRSCELANLADLASDRRVIFYDQRGSGRSAAAPDSALWTTAQFVADLDSLRRTLGLTRVHLYGHSWGGALALEYLLTKGQDGVASVTLAGPLVSTPMWLATTDSLLGTLAPGSREQARAIEAKGPTDDRMYDLVIRRYTERFVRRGERSYEANTACATGGEVNFEIQQHLWGPSEFHATGSLRTFDRWNRLSELQLPALVIVGEHDEVTPSDAARIAGQIRGATVSVIPEAAHMAMQEQPKPYLRALRAFLKAADTR
jgi:proline iminopeptidase